MWRTELPAGLRGTPGGRSALARAVAWLCLAAVVAAGAAGVAAADGDGNVTSGADGEAVTVAVIGDGVERRGATAYVRQAASPTVDVRYRGHGDAIQEICLVNEWALGRERLRTCRAPTAASGASTGAFFRPSGWFSDDPGRHRVIVRLLGTDGATLEHRLAVVVLRAGGDRDGDGLANGAELRRDTHPAAADTDGDGYADGLEVERGSDPSDPDDTPGLGLPDGGGEAASSATPAALSETLARLVALLPIGRAAVLPAALAGLAVLAAVAGLAGRRYAGRAGPVPADRSPDEQYVLRLLSASGGQLRQSEIVERSGWSKAKVSRLLSELEAAGDLEKVAVGRENVVVLPGEEPRLADDE